MPAKDLETLKKWWTTFGDNTDDSRKQSQQDRDYRDGNQWTPAEKAELRQRNQPIVTRNRIGPKVNFVAGTEARTRVDPDALPRTPAHEDAAEAITDALRYVSDREKINSRIRARVFDSLIVEGTGGAVIETEVIKDRDGNERTDIKVRRVAWNRLWYDPHSVEPDFSDAKYLGVVTWMDREDAEARYPKAKTTLEEAFGGEGDESGDTFEDKPKVFVDKTRNRVRILEVYYKSAGSWYVAHFTKAGFLIEPEEVSFEDEDGNSVCPLQMVSAYVAGDDYNTRYGIVRQMISIQDEINKRASKALHLLNNRQTWGEAGAVRDVYNTKAELAKPDGHVEVADGALSEGRFIAAPTNDMTQGQLTLLQEAKNEIDAIGPSVSNLTFNSQTSGRSVLAQQQLASLELETVFDNFRDWEERVYKQVWYRIRQFWKEERWLRVRDEKTKTGYRFTAINRSMTRAQRAKELMEDGQSMEQALRAVNAVQTLEQAPVTLQQIQQEAEALAQQGVQVPQSLLQSRVNQVIFGNEEMQQPIKINDIERLDVDVVLTVAPDTAVLQQEQFEILVGLAEKGALPLSPKQIIMASQLKNKRELIEELESQEQQDPQQAQLAQAAASLEIQQKQADIGATQAKAEKDQAQAVKAAADAGVAVGGLGSLGSAFTQ